MPVSAEHYRETILAQLSPHRDTAIASLDAILADLPERTSDLGLMIFPTQDGDGFFTIQVTLDGPDLAVRNRAIRDHATLFDMDDAAQEALQLDPFDTDFDVNTVIAETAAQWLEQLWPEVAHHDSAPASYIAAPQGTCDFPRRALPAG